MASVSEIYRYLDGLLPRSLSASWDNDGLMVCADPRREVKKILFALDITPAVTEYAAEISADLILSHHPLIFHGIRCLDGADAVSRKVMFLIRNGIAAMSFHTRLDAAAGGINDILAERLTLANIENFGPDGDASGRIGTLREPASFDTFCHMVKKSLNAPSLCVAKGKDTVRRVAVLGGAGKDYIEPAARAGADVLVTGEAGYNHLLEAAENGMSVITAGHYHTEILFSDFFTDKIGRVFPGIEFCHFPAGCLPLYF